jgi:predicted MFS family arabinose efflux permease
VKRSPPSDSTRLPFVVYLLAIGTFLMCTSEFLIAGLLPEMASAFGISLARTGLLITAFAIGMIIGGPTMALATTRLPRRVALVLALVVFAAGHVIVAVSSDFAVVVAARVLTALVTGAFWAVASVVATQAAGPVNASRAPGMMMSGVGLSTVVGVPVGSWAGQHIGWRGAFRGLAVLAAASALVFWRLVPTNDGHEVVPVRGQLGLAVRYGSTASTLTTGLVVSAFNAGIAGAVWTAGEALDSSLGATGPALSGAVLVAIGLIPLLALAVLIIRRRDRVDAPRQEPLDEALAST